MHFNKFNGQRKEWFTRKSCAVSFAYNNLQSDLTQPTEYKLNRIQSYGYRVSFHTDLYTDGKPEMVIDHPHYWTFIVAEKEWVFKVNRITL